MPSANCRIHLRGAPAARALLRVEIAALEAVGDNLVVVTGAGSGIGRATASAFALEGAEVVVGDVDEVGRNRPSRRSPAAVCAAHSYLVDVADADAVERFAEQVCAAHGVPDIVVNNAGIGVAGAFLDTPAEQFDRVLRSTSGSGNYI